MRHAARALALALVCAALLTGCVPGLFGPKAPSESTPTLETVDAALEPYYHQVLTWHDCGDGMQCSTATAPMDWANPGGDTIELALIRHYAATGAPRGSLLINPGGPGASGVDFVRDSLDYAASDALQRDFTIVGFDPRGVGASSAVSCAANDAELDVIFFGDESDWIEAEVGSDEWLAASEADGRELGAACLEHTGPLLGFVDTVSAARDLDMLRAALGDETLSYLGFSYGTYLGATYAELFPTRAGRLVLDGAIDPSTSEFDVTRTQARGFEDALDAYLADCLTRKGCPFDVTVDEVRTRIAEVITRLDKEPLEAADGRLLSGGLLTTAIILPLYNESNWTLLDDLFSEITRDELDTAFFLIDYYYDRTADGRYTTNGTEAFLAINCLDYVSDNNPDTMRAEAAILAEESPIFGPSMSYGATLCPQWPFVSEKQRLPITAPGSPDILVVGTTGDPATPYEWAVALSEQLEKGHLVTYQGEGHTAYGASGCVTRVVDGFFLDGAIPDADPMCAVDAR